MGKKKNKKNQDDGPKCTHYGLKKICNIGKSTVYAGSLRDVRSQWRTINPELIISLCGDRNSCEPFCQFSEGSEELLPSLKSYEEQFLQKCPVLNVEWPDYNVPDVELDWFHTLLADLSEIDGDVIVHCVGGHGRTGTFLSAMLHLTGEYAGVDIVKRLRNFYCEKAVESTTQLNWLKKLGVETGAEIHKSKKGDGEIVCLSDFSN